MSVKVSILIPTFNQEQYIEKAIISALNQKFESIEVIVSDDNSTDNTYNIAAKIKDKKLFVFKNKINIGRVANYRNLLFEYASGDYVLMLDGDDYLVDDEYIAKAFSLIDKEKDLCLVFADYRIDVEYSGKYLDSNMKLPDVIDGNILFRNYLSKKIQIPHLTALYSRKKAVALDFYRKNIQSSDWESLLRLIINGRVGFIRNVIGVWRIHGRGESSQLDLEKRILNASYIDSVYEYAKSQNAFNKKELDVWRHKLLKRNLSETLHAYLATGRHENAKKLMDHIFNKHRSVYWGILMQPETFFRWIISYTPVLNKIIKKSVTYSS